jgi:hypothetical protein
MVTKKKVTDLSFMPKDILPKPRMCTGYVFEEKYHGSGYVIRSTLRDTKLVSTGWKLFVVDLDLPYIESTGHVFVPQGNTIWVR